MKLPYYINEPLHAYLKMSSEDRRALMDLAYFNDDPRSCSVAYLPYFIAETGIDIEELNESEHRMLLLSAMKSIEYAGTAKALRVALGVLGDVRIEEKSNFSFVFDCSMLDYEITPGLERAIKNIVQYAKNARSVLSEIRIGYLNLCSINLSTGGVGEVCINTEMLEGYRTRLRDTVVLHTGAVGETSYRATMGGVL